MDDALAAHGLRRHVALVVPTYAAALLVVARTDLLGLMRREMGRRKIEAMGLVALEPPVPLPPIEICQAWHQRYEADGAHRWLRQCVRDAATSLAADGVS